MCSGRSTSRCRRRRRREQRGPVAGQPLRFRRVEPSEADEICANLARVHQDALRSGMALGALESMGRGALQRSYRDVVASLDDRKRLLLVVEEEGEIVGMAQL